MEDPKKIQLRKHKRLATGLFFLMAAIYAVMVYCQHQNPQSWMGYVEAFSEAGMVGALADWFAVTALFRHPLGLKIPHTNLIERKKDDLGHNLGSFVKDNFLNPENIRPYIEKLDVIKWVSAWLDKASNRTMLEREVVNLTKKIITDLDDDEVEGFLNRKGVELLEGVDYQKIASSGLHYFIDRNEHLNLLETILPQIKDYVNESRGMIKDKLMENRPFIAFLAGKKISDEVVEGLLKFIDEILVDKNHFVRKKLTLNLEELAVDLVAADKWKTKFDSLKTELITSESIKPYSDDAWKAIKGLLLENLENPDSQLKHYLEKNIQKLADSLAHDEELGNRINNWIRHFLYRMALKNRDEVEALISTTVAGWEGKELSEKLELEVGKDLQFIRINGTLVGGLVGLIIHTVTQIFI